MDGGDFDRRNVWPPIHSGRQFVEALINIEKNLADAQTVVNFFVFVRIFFIITSIVFIFDSFVKLKPSWASRLPRVTARPKLTHSIGLPYGEVVSPYLD